MEKICFKISFELLRTFSCNEIKCNETQKSVMSVAIPPINPNETTKNCSEQTDVEENPNVITKHCSEEIAVEGEELSAFTSEVENEGVDLSFFTSDPTSDENNKIDSILFSPLSPNARVITVKQQNVPNATRGLEKMKRALFIVTPVSKERVDASAGPPW